MTLGKEEPKYLKSEEDLEDYLLEKGIENMRLILPGDKGQLSGRGLLEMVKKAIRLDKILHRLAKRKMDPDILLAFAQQESFSKNSLKAEKEVNRVIEQVKKALKKEKKDKGEIEFQMDKDPEHGSYNLRCFTSSNGSRIVTSIFSNVGTTMSTYAILLPILALVILAGMIGLIWMSRSRYA